jgi:hypothetical protein
MNLQEFYINKVLIQFFLICVNFFLTPSISSMRIWFHMTSKTPLPPQKNKELI